MMPLGMTTTAVLLRTGAIVLLAVQVAMLVLLLARLMPGRTRRPPAQPLLDAPTHTTVTVVVAALNEEIGRAHV